MRVPLPREGFRIGVDSNPVGAYYVIADTEAERPATAPIADLCFTKDSKKLWKGDGSTWSDTAAAAGSGDTFTKLVQSANVSTLADINPVSCPGLVFTFVAGGVYTIDLYMLTQAALTTTGHGFQFDTSVAVSVVEVNFDAPLAATGTVTGGFSLADDASAGVSSGRPTINSPTLSKGAGLLVAGANGGTAQLRFRSEVAAVATCLGGSVMRVLRIA